MNPEKELTSSDSSFSSTFSSFFASAAAGAAPPLAGAAATATPPPPEGTDANFSLPEAITSAISLPLISDKNNSILSSSPSAPTAHQKKTIPSKLYYKSTN